MPREVWPVGVSLRRDGRFVLARMAFDPPRGKCSCGAQSGPMDSSADVRRWLVEHEHEVRR